MENMPDQQRDILPHGYASDLAGPQTVSDTAFQALLLNASREAIIGTDAEFIVRICNPAAAELLGLQAADPAGKSIFDLLPPRTADSLRAEIQKSGKGQAQFARTAESGPERIIEVGADACRLQDGSTAGFSFSLRDVTGQVHPMYRKAIEAERAMLDKILEQLPSGVIIVDAPDGAIMRANRAAVEMFEGNFTYSENIIAYDEWTGFTPEGVRYQPESWPVARSIRSGEVVVNEEIIFPLDAGDERIMAVNSAPVRNSDGKIIAGVIVMDDITERKEAEQSLIESQQRLALALQAANMITWVWDAAANQMMITGAFRDVYGLTDPARGEDAIRLVHRDDRHQHLAEVKKALYQGKNYYSQFRIHHGETGELCWLEEWGIPVMGADGQLRKLIGVVKNITDQKRTEENLRNSERSLHMIAERFRASVESLLDGFAILSAVRDENGTIVDFRYDYVNETGCRMNNRTYQEQVGQSLLDLLPAHRDTGLFDRYVRVVETGIPLVAEDEDYEDIYGGGKRLRRSFEVRAVKLGDGFVVTWRDITSRKQTEEQLKMYAARLEQSNQELDQFALIASHDLQEPLRKIRQFSDSLRRTLGGNIPAEAEDSLNRMQRAAERMQAMIDGLLELSRVNTRGGKFESADLTRLVKEVISDLEPRLEASRGQVICEPLPTAEVDVVQFRRLMQNLISNALKYYRKDTPPVVQLRAAVLDADRKNPARLALTVQDNGIGFNEEDTQRIFRPFQRLHGIGEYEGTGMGLAICQKIVERHRGRIEVHSSPDEGSTFTVVIPVHQR